MSNSHGPQNFNHEKIALPIVPSKTRLQDVGLIETEEDELRRTPKMIKNCGPSCTLKSVYWWPVVTFIRIDLQRLADVDPATCDLYVSGTGGKISLACVQGRWWIVFGVKSVPKLHVSRLTLHSLPGAQPVFSPTLLQDAFKWHLTNPGRFGSHDLDGQWNGRLTIKA